MFKREDLAMTDEAVEKVCGGAQEAAEYRCIHCGDHFLASELESAKNERCFGRSEGNHEFKE